MVSAGTDASLTLVAIRCAATACACTLMGILSAMTSGSMPTPLTFILLVGLRRLGTSCSLPRVRAPWVDPWKTVTSQTSLQVTPHPTFFFKPKTLATFSVPL